MQLHLGFTALAGLAVLAAVSATPTANAQCSSGRYSAWYGGSGYNAPPPATTYYAPSYALPQYYSPPVWYSQPTYRYSQPPYRSYSLNLGIGGHRDGIRRSGHSDYRHRGGDRRGRDSHHGRRHH
ncbi:hypothetical protein RAS1_42680 [Phycisphaerae bacterium RAS1]|nr:hypothetical protein RAS1_42680 [Phycisphaerae bacterium RAS1]